MASAQSELEFVKACQSSLQESTFTFANTNGVIYGGLGVIVDEVSLSGKDSKFSFKGSAALASQNNNYEFY